MKRLAGCAVTAVFAGALALGVGPALADDSPPPPEDEKTCLWATTGGCISTPLPTPSLEDILALLPFPLF